MLLRPVATGTCKDVTSSLLSWHKRYDFNAANFNVIANENARYKRSELESTVVYFKLIDICTLQDKLSCHEHMKTANLV